MLSAKLLLDIQTFTEANLWVFPNEKDFEN